MFEQELFTAARKGDVKGLLDLIQKGANLNCRDNTNKTLIHTAAQYGHVKIIKELLKYGLAIDARDDSNGTALHCACLYQYPNVVKLLLKKGADVESKIKTQNHTPLHVASFFANDEDGCEIIQLLLDNKANIHARNHQDKTPLSYLLRNDYDGQKEMVKMFWEKGASVTQLDAQCFAKLLPIIIEPEGSGTLDLSRRGLTDDQLIHLANVLKSNTSITKLVLADNQFSHQGMYELADALRHNQTLQILDLSHNKKIASRFFWTSGFQYLISALHENRNSSLGQLNLMGCVFDWSDMLTFIMYLTKWKPKTLKQIYFDDDVDSQLDYFNGWQRNVFFKSKNKAILLDIERSLLKHLPAYEEESWQALQSQLSNNKLSRISELSIEEKKLWVVHEITSCLKKYKSQFIFIQNSLKAKSSYLQAISTLLMECADIISVGNIPEFAPWISSMQQIIDAERTSLVLEEADKHYDPSLSYAQDIKPVEVFHQSFQRRMNALYSAAVIINSQYVKCEIKTPLEKAAKALKHIISGLTGFGKMVDGTIQLMSVAGEGAVTLLERAELVDAVSHAATACLKMPLGDHAADHLMDKIVRQIYNLTEKDKCENLENCFSNTKTQLSKIKSLAYAICHHYQDVIEKLTPIEAESLAKYAFLHLADLFMSGTISGPLRKPLTAFQLAEEAILWLSYMSMRDNVRQIDNIMTTEEKQLRQKQFMQPTIKFKGSVTTQHAGYPPRWATQKEADTFNQWLKVRHNDHTCEEININAAMTYSTIVNQKELLKLKGDSACFVTVLSSYQSPSKKLYAHDIRIHELENEVSGLKRELAEIRQELHDHNHIVKLPNKKAVRPRSQSSTLTLFKPSKANTMLVSVEIKTKKL